MFSNFTTIYSNYNYQLAFGSDDRNKFEWDSKIETLNVKPEFTYFINTNNEMSIGGDFLMYRFEPANAIGVSDGKKTDISPPKEVIGAFKDVASAKEDKNRMINQAEGYRNDVIPKARGEAEAMIRDAEGFRDSRVKRAEGDAAKFTTILKEYNKAKSITEKRLYLETMEKVLPDIEKIIVPDKDSGNMRNLLNLFPGAGKEGGKK